MDKLWINRATALFSACRDPIPHEINQLDWKAALSANKERLTEHLIAFANQANGGFLVYGVADKGSTLLGIDTEQVEAVIKQLTNLGRDAIDPPLILDHTVLDIEGVPLLFIYVQEPSIKPVHLRGKSIEEAWIRSGGSTRKASRSEIGTLMLHSPAPRWEDLRATSLLPADEVLAHLDLTTIAKLSERPLPNDGQEMMRWLIAQRMVIADGSGYYITNFGGVAAARELAQFESLKRKAFRVIRYQGTNKVTTINEIVGIKGYAVGFEGLINYLKQVLPHSEVIEQSLRRRVSMYPDIALRELIANALIHQDFTIAGAGPTIEIFDDRITFTSPGNLLSSKKLDRLIGTNPESRNEWLASKFRIYRIGEERGTGFQKVIESVELFGLPPVLFRELDNAFQVTIFAPREFAQMSQNDRVEARAQHAELQYLSSKTLTNSSLRERFKFSERQRNQITNVITDTVAAGRIKRKDSTSGNKFAEYVPYWV